MKLWKMSALLMSAMPPSTAFAGGWGFRNDDCAPGSRDARGEWKPAFSRSKKLEWLDYAGLACHAEATRQAVNTQYLTQYQRPLLASIPDQAPAAVSTPAGEPRLPTLETPSTTPPVPTGVGVR